MRMESLFEPHKYFECKKEQAIFDFECNLEKMCCISAPKAWLVKNTIYIKG